MQNGKIHRRITGVDLEEGPGGVGAPPPPPSEKVSLNFSFVIKHFFICTPTPFNISGSYVSFVPPLSIFLDLFLNY